MKSLKLFAVVALCGAFFWSCETESLNEDQQLIEEIDVITGTKDGVKSLNDDDNDDDNVSGDKDLMDAVNTAYGTGNDDDHTEDDPDGEGN